MDYPARVLTPAPESARAAPQGQIVSVVLELLQNQLLNGRVLMGSAVVGGSVLVSNLVLRAGVTLARVAAIEPGSIPRKAANFMWSL